MRPVIVTLFRPCLRGLLVLFLSIWMMGFAQAVAFPNAASALPLVLVREDDEGYRYEQTGTGIGFDSLVREDDPEIYGALFEIDEGVYYELWRDGEMIPYASGDAITGEGDYQLLIAASENQRDSAFSLFTFHIDPWLFVLDSGHVVVSYVRSYEMFGFSADGEPLFMLSVPNGGQSRETVRFVPVSEDVSMVEFYFNGERQMDKTQREFSSPGNYLLRLKLDILTEYWVAFRVTSSDDASLTFLPLPDGISCQSPSGTQLLGNTLYLPRDGAYQLNFSCDTYDAKETWVESLNRDTMLPGVCFSESISSGQVRKKMRVTAISPDAKLLVLLDGLPQTVSDGSFEFKDDGRYRVLVFDRAGNAQDLTFYLYQLNHFVWTGLGLVGLLVAMFFLSKWKQRNENKI